MAAQESETWAFRIWDTVHFNYHFVTENAICRFEAYVMYTISAKLYIVNSNNSDVILARRLAGKQLLC